MFVASSRLSILLNGPPFLFHHRPCTLLRLTNHHYLSCPLPPLSAIPHSLIHLSRSNSHFPINSSQQYQSRSTSNTPQENNHVPSDAHLVPPSHPWPEWSELLESISIAGHFDANRNIKDEFVPNESLSMEFVDAACSFLGFAHNRPDFLGWLPKDDIQVLVNNGPPFLFKNATETEKIMRSFLQGEESSEATTFDLMKYILSYASNPIFYPERNIKEATELSARNLLKEMANLNGKKGEALSMQGIEKFNKTGQDEQTPRNLGPNINMKRGDWICQKCSFMNFAKNTKCIECQELRPQRQLTGGEWDCPKCNFFNNGRNIVCLKCECRRPGEVSDDFKVQKTYSKSDSGYAPFVPLPADMFAKKTENIKSEQTSTVSENNSEQSVTKIENQIKDIAEEEISEKWFKKVAELHDVTDLTSVISDDDFPKIMPMRKGENRFVVSKKKDRSLNSTTYKRQQAIEQEKSNNFVPFVPFPPDYFAKKDNNQQSNSTNLSQTSHENSSNAANDIINLVQETRNTQIRKSENVSNETEEKSTNSSYMSLENSSKATNEINLVQETRNTQINRSENRPESSSGDRDNQNLRNGSSLEGSAVKETDPLDMSEEAKAERWFRRVAQIKDISELSQIPDEDFPSIMPMRKGVNRFVVSKRKTPLERRLTSPEYRKNLRTVRSEPSKKEGDGS